VCVLYKVVLPGLPFFTPTEAGEDRGSVRARHSGRMSYYNNAPRLFTPSPFKITKTSSAVESFGAISDSTGVEALAPQQVNTCHRSRAAYLQHSHPRTYALLRKAEVERQANAAMTLAKP